MHAQGTCLRPKFVVFAITKTISYPKCFTQNQAKFTDLWISPNFGVEFKSSAVCVANNEFSQGCKTNKDQTFINLALKYDFAVRNSTHPFPFGEVGVNVWVSVASMLTCRLGWESNSSGFVQTPFGYFAMHYWMNSSYRWVYSIVNDSQCWFHRINIVSLHNVMED